MAIERGIYGAPQGLDFGDAQELEIEIVNPEMVTLDDGSVEITLMPEMDDAEGAPFDANLADYMDDSALDVLSKDLLGYVEADVSSRKD